MLPADQAAVELHERAGRTTDLHRHALGLATLHEIHERAVGGRDDRFRRHGDGILIDREFETHRHELAGPQRPIGVGDPGLEQHGAGGTIDRVVDEGQRSGDLLAAIAHIGDDAHRERLVETGPAAHFFERLFRHGEAHQHGLEFVDREQWRIGLRADQTPHAKRDLSRAPGDRGLDGGVLEIEPRPLQRRPAGRHGRGQGGGLGEGLIELLTGHVAVLGQSGEAHRVASRAEQGGLIARQRALQPIEFGAERSGIDLEEHLPLADFIAFGDGHPGEHARHE